jgi:hypothetical protein
MLSFDDVLWLSTSMSMAHHGTAKQFISPRSIACKSLD